MERTTKLLFLTLSSLALWPAAAGAATEGRAPDLTPKGIYHDVERHQRTGIKFYIVMDDSGRRVATAYPFHSGDRFTFSFEINRGTYIYVINRTELKELSTVSSGFQAKRITRTRDSDRPSYTLNLSEPRLLFPTYRAGSNNRVMANVSHQVPHRGFFAMDEQHGTEKLYVVISDQRLDLDEFFDPRNGHTRTRDGSNPAAGALAELESRLAEWQANAHVELIPKGIHHQVDSYGVSIDPSKPAMVEIDLKHYK